MKKERPLELMLLATAFCPFLLSSCVDDAYDLDKDIDMTVTVGGDNLALPASSTEFISLSKLFDLDEGSALKTIQNEEEAQKYNLHVGDYYLHESNGDSPEISTLNVERQNIAFNQTEVTEEAVEFTKPSIAGELAATTLYNTSTDFCLNPEYEVNGQLRDLNWMTLYAPLNLSISAQGQLDGCEFYLGENLTISFSDFLTLTKTSDESWYRIADNGHDVIITQDVLASGNEKIIALAITRIDLPEGDDQGLIESNEKDDNGNYLPGQFKLDMHLDAKGNVKMLMPAGETNVNATIKAEVTINEAEILEANGRIAPHLEKAIDPVKFVDIPDFLNNEDTHIDLYNPTLYLSMDNQLPIDFTLGATLTPMDKNGADIEANKVEIKESHGLSFPHNATKEYALSRQGNGSLKPDVENIKLSTLSNLIYTIPDQIKIEDIQINTPNYLTLEMNKSYQAQTKYELVAPLSFGRDLAFAYRDTIDDWNNDIKDVDLPELEMSVKTVNEIPMDMKLVAEPIGLPIDGDKNNRLPVTGVTITVNGSQAGDIIKAPAAEEQYGEQTFTINIKTNEKWGLKDLDGIVLKVEGTCPPSIEGVAMNKNMTLQLKDIIVRIKGGVTIDAN